MLIQIENNLDKQPSTLSSYLSVNGTTGGTVVPVKNINGFNSSWAIQLGKTGEEQAEILNISGAVAGTALNTAGTARFAHPIDTPVYQIHYDSVIILRSTSGTTGSPSAIATVSITPDSFYTEYNDSAGVATYAYQSQYYNAVSGDSSGTSPWFVPGGPTFYSFQKLKDRAKKTLYSANYIKDDATIGDWINEWLEVMTNAAIKVNQGYSIGTALYGFTPSGTPSLALGTITDAAFKQVVKMEITYDNGTSYVNSQEIPLNGFGMNDNFSAIYPRHYWQGDTVFGVLPGNSGTARVTYSIRSTPLSNDTDELPQTMKAYTTGCIEYVLWRAFDLDQKADQADSHYQKFVLHQNAFVTEITPRDQTGIKMINLSESISGMNEDVVLSTEYFL